MHLLHRSSMDGGGGGRALRRVGSSPRAPPTPRQHLFSKSDSIKKRSATAKRSGAKQGSKRSRLRAGLAAALQELRLAGRGRKQGGAGAVADVGAGAARPCAGGACSGPGSSAALLVAASADEGSASRATTTGSGRRAGWPPLVLLLAVLALACVVALGRAPAVCCCTCAAWLCRGPSTTPAGEHRRSSSIAECHAGDGSSSSSRGG